MKLAIMQPYFFPYIGYFQLMNYVDIYVIYDDVNYINRGWINRNNVLVGGKPQLITLSLKSASQNKLINEIYILKEAKSVNKLLKTIENSYKKAPYYHQVYPIIEQCLKAEVSKISKLNVLILKTLSGYLDIKTKIIETSVSYNNNGLKGEKRIIDICLKEQATKYINPVGGRKLYSKELFIKNNIELSFMKSKPKEYKQLKHEFVPFLSVIDVLMFNSPEEIKEMLTNYELL